MKPSCGNTFRTCTKQKDTSDKKGLELIQTFFFYLQNER